MKTSNFISTLAIILASALFSFSTSAQETATGEEAYIERRVAFFQENFSKFVTLQFKKDTNSNAAIQILHVKENTFVYDGTNYCGFKFTVPQWLDGDFMWTYLVAKTETNKDFNGHGLSWYIIPETGRSKGFENFQGDLVANYPLLQAQFPYTHHMTIQNLAMERLIPGKTYGIWFGYTDQDQPDIAFAMTITSDRGAKEFGDLPLR